ncbi:DUF5117 domain-containing protein, partial [uncultured Mucilaginibacter sp.]|uniref:DUF5117 domain-containing protein n=1 Tax=uncultured Mucilaginibacter sp. TaxID=797541 RepID=UPI0026380C90
MKYFLPLTAAVFGVGSLAVAQNQIPQTQNQRTDTKPAATIASITQNLKKFDGFYTFYYDEKSGKVYLEISNFDKDFLYFSSLVDGVGNGGPERGQASSVITRFIKVGPKVFLVQPVTNYRSVNGNADEKKAVENSFAKSVIFGFAPVAAEGGKVLIDLTPFIIRDSQRIGDVLGTAGGNPGAAASRGANRGIAGGSAAGGYRLDESRSAVFTDNTKNFPKNTEFEALLTFTGGSGRAASFGRGGGIAADPSAVTVRMHQAFVELPDGNFKPRKFDPRSGFNAFSYYDFSALMSEPIIKRFTARHRLEKKNPNAAMSEAVEPIVYYIDRGA